MTLKRNILLQPLGNKMNGVVILPSLIKKLFPDETNIAEPTKKTIIYNTDKNWYSS